jgi:type I restriction enzyme S subunit
MQGVWGDGVPFITPSDIDRQGNLLPVERKLSSYGRKYVRELPPGSVLMTCIGIIGKVALTNATTATNQQINAAIPNPWVSGSYLRAALQSIIPQATALAGMQVLPILNLTKFKSLRLAVPPTVEQKLIAEILDTADEAIRSTERLIAKLEQAKQGLLHDIMTQGIEEGGQLRSSHRSAVAYVDIQRELLPDGWRIMATGDLFEIQLGKMLDTKSFGTGPRYSYLTNRNVQWGRFVLDDLEEMPFGDADVRKFALSGGDVLVCEGGEVGRCAVWRYADLRVFYQKALHRLRSRGEIFPDFFALYMAWLARHHGFAKFVGQTSIAHLPREKLAIVPVRVPPLPEQKRILAAVSAYDCLSALEQQRIAKLRIVKQGLMDDLLTGQVRAEASA